MTVATVTLMSAKGSPGVSSLTIGLALAWPVSNPGRSVLAVDADPAGGDFAAGILGGALPAGSGMIPLATARGMDPAEAVSSAAVHLREDGSARLIAGVPDSSRAGALVLAWDRLVAARPGLDESRTDLLVDAGRVDLARAPSPWVVEADLSLLVVRPTLPAVTAAHRFVLGWTKLAEGRRTPPLELVIVDAPSPYRPGEVAAAVGVPCRAVVPFDPPRARAHSEGISGGRSFGRSGYARAIVGLAQALGRNPAGGVDAHPSVGQADGPPEPVGGTGLSGADAMGADASRPGEILEPGEAT